MRTHGHHKRVLLFLVAVVLPSSVLIVLTWRVIGQQQELHQKRLGDDRRRMAREIGQELLVRLEEIKLRELSATASGATLLDTLDYTSDEIVLTGLANGERLWLPWEVNQSRAELRGSLSESASAQKIRQAEQEEYIQGQFAQAAALYLECIEEAHLPAQRAYARLLRARVLAKLGQADESLGEYRTVLATPSEVTDEHGVPLCLYAAGPLLERRDSYEEVARLIRMELDARRWLVPAEAYMVRDLVAMLVRAGPESGIQLKTADGYLERISERIHRLEQALVLQEDFPLVLKTLLSNPSQKPQRIWVPFGQEPWLVGLAPALPEKQRLVIAVRGARILDSVLANVPYSESLPEDVRLTSSADVEGESLGSSFPGLRLAFPASGPDSLPGHWSLQRSFYVIAVCLVLCVTLFGAYLLWSDVGRELRMAEMRSQFIASVSHELKTPLTAIRMFAETLRLGRAEDSQARAEYLDTIINESHRLTRLLNNVLDFSKIEKGKRTYRKEPASLSEVAHAAARAMQYTFAQQDFRLSVDVEDDLPDIPVDRDAIEQAILNLLSNAMKYSGESRVIGLRVRQGPEHALIEVSDEGIGIDPAQQQRIFEKFYRMPGEGNERIPGTGLGLALVFHIVQAHGGHVEVQSQPGEGSTFSIHLPLEGKR
jgi:tetratricopeptide (TPR) repeat protein